MIDTTDVKTYLLGLLGRNLATKRILHGATVEVAEEALVAADSLTVSTLAIIMGWLAYTGHPILFQLHRPINSPLAVRRNLNVGIVARDHSPWPMESLLVGRGLTPADQAKCLPCKRGLTLPLTNIK